MTKIDRVEDLPEWFDLKKYRGCESFGATEWFFHLDIRKGIHVFFNLLKNYQQEISIYLDTPVQSEGNPTVPPRTELEALRDRPLSLEGGNGLLWKHSPESLEHIKILKDLTFCDLHFKKSCDQDDRATIDLRSRRWTELLQAPSHETPDELQNLPVGVIPGRCSDVAKPILVELSASDRELKQAFSNWLKNTRSESKDLLPKRSKPLFNRWARYGLLPYIDLLIWSIETESNIPDRVMADAIGSKNAGESNLSKTIAPLAANLLRDLSEGGCWS